MIKYPKFALFLCTVSIILAASCASSAHPTTESVVEEGSRLFSEGKIAEAEKTWADIPDSEKREEYSSFVKAYSAFDEKVSDAEKALSSADPEAAISAASGSGSLPKAPEALAATDPRGAAERLERVASAAGADLARRAAAAEAAAEKSLAAARSGAIADRVAAASKAAELFSEAARLYRDAGPWVPASNAEARSSGAASKASEAEALHKSLLKDSLLSFSERMGEIFARSPSDAKKLDDKDLLAFNSETSSMIQGGIEEFDRLVAAYPDLIDSGTAKKLRLSATSLSARFTRMEGAIKATRNRGKPVIPLIIGIFNPQPGDPQRSRPGSFSGGTVAGSDWWWGIADIPKGVAQDLVVTMSDSRPVRVYAAGRGAGGSTASDLVNPLFRVGNSWPVLNAGVRLENGVFHIEVGPGGASDYKGEAVVYKSFVTRTR